MIIIVSLLTVGRFSCCGANVSQPEIKYYVTMIAQYKKTILHAYNLHNLHLQSKSLFLIVPLKSFGRACHFEARKLEYT